MTPTGTEQVKQLNLQQQRQRQLQLLLQQKQQQLLLQQLNPTVVLSWPAAAPAVAGRPALDEADDGLGAAWPPRSYPCAFCRREFRSAQALGGHMNVHRRDRARMRGHVNGAAQTQGASPPEAPRAAAAVKEFALLYPVLNSNTTGAVFVPGGELAHLATPVTLADHGQCHVSGDDKEIDLELRLGWS